MVGGVCDKGPADAAFIMRPLIKPLPVESCELGSIEGEGRVAADAVGMGIGFGADARRAACRADIRVTGSSGSSSLSPATR